MAQFLLITTLLTIAGLIATSIAGFLASPGHVAQHIFFALGTVVLGLFSQSMTMFFFIGTGKQLKEATNQNPEVVQQTRAFKMRVSPASMYAMVLLMILFITGGGVAGGKTPHWLHLTLAIVTILVYAWAYWIEIQAMEKNARLMDKFLSE